MNTKGKAIIFSAPSGAGKTTIVRALLDAGLPMEFSISACSREPRGEEVNGKDYFFLGIDGFKTAVEKNEFFEWEEVYPFQFYGTLNSEVERIWASGNSVIFDVDVYGAIELKKQLGGNALAIFIKPPSIDALKQRLKQRKTESDEKIDTRIQKAQEELELQTEFDRVILNDQLDAAVKESMDEIMNFLEK